MVEKFGPYVHDGNCGLCGKESDAYPGMLCSKCVVKHLRPYPPPMQVRLRRLRGYAGPLPSYATFGAAGLDLYANGAATLRPGDIAHVGTGIAVEIPVGFEGQVRGRSGLARRHGIELLNAPGTIDSDYRGEVGVILVNLGRETYVVQPGDRIAQLVIAPVVRVELVEVEELSETERGGGGFGSTGR